MNKHTNFTFTLRQKVYIAPAGPVPKAPSMFYL